MTDRDAVRRSYDELAETYADERSDDTLGVELVGELFEALPKQARLLDAGCGQGTPVLNRVPEAIDATGIDLSREQLRLAASNAPTARLVHGEMGTLPFRTETFDAVTAVHSLIHVPLDDHPAVLDEFARVLRPNGSVLVSEGSTEWVGSNPDWLDSGVEMHWEIAGPETTRAQLRSAGFSIVDEWGVPDNLADEDGGRKPFFLARLDE